MLHILAIYLILQVITGEILWHVLQTTCSITVEHNDGCVHADGIRDEMEYKEPGETMKRVVLYFHLATAQELHESQQQTFYHTLFLWLLCQIVFYNSFQHVKDRNC